MGNPQETVSEFELGWFAGFIDGEGAIGISIRNRQEDGRQHITPKPHLQVANTEPVLIEKCMYILDKMGVPYHISSYPSPSGNRKPYWTIVIAGQKRVMKILPELTPFLQSIKQEKARLVMEFCRSRENANRGEGYSTKEMEIIDHLFELNGRGKSKIQVPQRLHARRLVP